MKVTLGQLAEAIGAKLAGGDPESVAAMAEKTVERLGSLAEACEGCLSFLANPKYADQLAATKATAVIVGDNCPDAGAPAGTALLRVDNPDLAFAKASLLVSPPPAAPAPGIHPSAVVSPSAVIGRGVSIGACTVVEDGAVIGDGCVLFPQVYVGKGSAIGDGCLLYAGVKVYHQVTVGRGCIFHSGAVIGSDGFGFAWTGQGFFKIPQVGTVVVEDGVELGANTCVDRARFGETRIGAGTKLDNLIQIAHNVKLGKCCAFAAQVGIAGSATVGNGVQMGGQAAMAGHISIGDGLTIVGKSGVSKPLPGRESGVDPDKLVWINTPARPMKEELEERRNVKHLGTLRKTVKELQERIEKLESGRS